MAGCRDLQIDLRYDDHRVVALDHLPAQVPLGGDLDFERDSRFLDAPARLNLVVLEAARLALERHQDDLAVVRDPGEEERGRALENRTKRNEK